MDREGRPPRPDRLAPQLNRRRLGPVGLDSNAMNDAIAFRSAKARPLGFCFRRDRRWTFRFCCRGGRGRRCRRVSRFRDNGFLWRLHRHGSWWGLDVCLRQKPILGSRLPTPRELRQAIAGDAVGPKKCERSARQQDRREERNAPRFPPEAACGNRPCDEGEVHEWNPQEQREHPSHQPAADRLVDDVLRPYTATTIRTTAPIRSDQGARLKNSHHTRISRPATTATQDAVNGLLRKYAWQAKPGQ